MEIRKAAYLISSPRAELCPKPDRPEYAFIGRSNVGKSSLINMLTGQQRLAKTSASPGKTQLINHFAIESGPSPKEKGGEAATPQKWTAPQLWYLVDLPGYGFAKRSKTQRAEWQKMIAAYLRERPNLVTTFVLIDSRHKPQQLDIDFMAQLGEWNVPFNLAFTKADKSTQREVAANVRRFKDTMKEDWEFIPRNFITSTEKQLGRRDMLGFIEECNAEFRHP